MELEEIFIEASKLKEEERASIASRLLQTLESPYHWVSDEEVEQRIAEAEADSSVMISWDQLKGGLNRSGA